MEENSLPPNPRTVEEVFKDFLGRRAGVLKALTTDVEAFFQQCDPEKENLCLYGFPDELWEVNLPAEEVPPELPEPALGINFARDGMLRKDWLSLVAVHSDAWLVSVAFYFGARFDKNERKKLFNMINDMPTVLDVVTGRKPLKESIAPVKENSARESNAVSHKPNNNNNKANSSAVKAKPSKAPPSHDDNDYEDEAADEYDDEEDNYEGEEEEHESTLCGMCNENYGPDEFWICCDICERWFHGKCVKVTPARAEHIKHYKCPTCSNNKRQRA
ncbi:hypothetical protein L7F22_060781 [Adiantum nelumboides]|nr:hypothetical protein [Adiantum nelumboides]